MNQLALKEGDVVEVTAGSLAYGGDAVARYDGLALFIPLAAPGDRLRVRVSERKKNFARAEIEEIIEPSPQRRQPPCRYFGHCGGCQLQHISYESQLAAKVGFVRDALERIGRFDWPHEIQIHHSSELAYRSRAQLKIDHKSKRIGFSRRGSNTICDIESCPILAPELDSALNALRVAARTVWESGQRLSEFPQIGIAAGDSTVSFEPSLADLPGGDLQQTVGQATYSFSPSSFFQSNRPMLEVLVDEALSDSTGGFAIDLFAGVGLFTIQLARCFTRVIGIEADRRTATYALENISANNLTNVEFVTTSVEQWLKRPPEEMGDTPDLILLDPPRTGAAEAIGSIAALRPMRITYVSCDPTTLARDLRTLVESGYELLRVAAIDLFPQTYHVETVAHLRIR